jgi:hypothetical protein
MKKIIRLTESDLTRIVKRVINENESKKEPINEGLNDYLTLIGGTLVSFAAIKLFGRKILIGMLGLFLRGKVRGKCYKELESIGNLITNNPENLTVEYKKIKDYYQIIIDMKSFSSEYLFNNTKDYEDGQLDSYSFPAKLKLYDDGTIEFLCNSGEIFSENSDGEINERFIEFIQTYGEENPKLRSHDEKQIIGKIMFKHMPRTSSNLEDYNALVNLDRNTIEKISSEISQKLEIPQDVIVSAMERHQPTEEKDEETISTDTYYSPISDYYTEVYNDIIEYNNDDSLKESDLRRIIRKIIN